VHTIDKLVKMSL